MLNLLSNLRILWTAIGLTKS